MEKRYRIRQVIGILVFIFGLFAIYKVNSDYSFDKIRVVSNMTITEENGEYFCTTEFPDGCVDKKPCSVVEAIVGAPIAANLDQYHGKCK